MSKEPLISIIIGSASDAETLAGCRRALESYAIAHEIKILSAHRTPGELVAHVEGLEARGVRLVIAAAGMSAHLAGVVAAHTALPVLGVPVAAGALAGVDALLSTSQMPPGVPVGCLGIGAPGATNAAHLAARILAGSDPALRARLTEQTRSMREKVLAATVPPLA